MRITPGLRCGFLILAVVASLTKPGTADARADVDPEDLTKGLRVSYKAENRREVVRIVPDLSLDDSDGTPDLRLPRDRFQIRVNGFLLVQQIGPHRFFARTNESVRLRIAGQDVLKANAPIVLPPGPVPLVLEADHQAGGSRIAIDWEGPGFQREPIPARLLFHDAAGQTGTDLFENGRRTVERFACANCHTIAGLAPHPEIGPAFPETGPELSEAALARWLDDPGQFRKNSIMPGFRHLLNPEDRSALVAFLNREIKKRKPPVAELKMALNVASPAQGRLLFRSSGCLGCHSHQDLAVPPSGENPPIDLTGVAKKRTSLEIATLLTHPRSSGLSLHRPDLRLTPDESAHLGRYLGGDAQEPPPSQPGIAEIERGRRISVTLRCRSCHNIPRMDEPPPIGPLGPRSKLESGCLSERPTETRAPQLSVSPDERAAIRTFLKELPEQPSQSSTRILAEDSVRRRRCDGCHARDGRGGEALGRHVAAALASDSQLGALKGTLTPPDLTAVGDKLRPEYLASVLKGTAPTARPWLSVRMPIFSFEKGEADRIAEGWRAHDRMITKTGTDLEAEPTPVPQKLREEVAISLIGQKGFGCVSCHILDGKIPPGGEPETLGPDLALARKRMSERYFQRWIANPQRIIAGTPMPQFLKPIETLPGTLDEQLGAIWGLLNSPKVGESVAFGTREILKVVDGRPLVVRDMVLVPRAPRGPHVPRGLAIGMSNGASILFDTDSLAWVAAWQGGFLSRTKSGRLWEWHPEGTLSWVADGFVSPIEFREPSGTTTPPRSIRERFGSFRELTFGANEVTIRYELLGPRESKVTVVEQIQPVQYYLLRRVRVEGVPEGFEPVATTLESSRRRVPLARGANGSWTLEIPDSSKKGPR